jgi:hypothetical protein
MKNLYILFDCCRCNKSCCRCNIKIFLIWSIIKKVMKQSFFLHLTISSGPSKKCELLFFQIFMIRFDRIELPTYSYKPLDSMDFNAKEALNSSSVESNRKMKILKKCQKTLKIRNIVRPNVFHIFDSIRFDFDLIRIKFESFTVFNHCEVIGEIFVKLNQIVSLKLNSKNN